MTDPDPLKKRIEELEECLEEVLNWFDPNQHEPYRDEEECDICFGEINEATDKFEHEPDCNFLIWRKTLSEAK